jgi:hypothetical protein
LQEAGERHLKRLRERVWTGPFGGGKARWIEMRRPL